MKTGSKAPATINEYIADFPRGVQTVLKRVRDIIRKALPDAEEVISYRIPAFKLNGRIVLYFAGWTEHYSLYPSTNHLAAAFKNQLARYEVSGKGTIRLPLSQPVPARLIGDIAKFRAKEAAARAKAKAKAKAQKKG